MFLANTLLKTNFIGNKKIIQIPDTNDGLIYSYYGDVNYYTTHNLQMMTSTYYTDDMSCLLFFDVSGLAGKTINYAKLKIYGESFYANFNIGAKRITSSWDETTLTFNNKPTIDATSRDTFVPSGNGWKFLTVTEIIQEACNSQPYYGIYIYAIDNNYNWCQFGSKEGEHPPVLIVNYSN